MWSRYGDQEEIIQQNLEDVEAAVGGIAGFSACGLADPSSHDSHRQDIYLKLSEGHVTLHTKVVYPGSM
jgi:hypothetical protein